jgi:NADH-quinone oxidoreductase E subunit
MSDSTHITPFLQPEHFAFTPENREKAQALIKRYPAGRQASAVMPLLTLAQKQNANWLPRAAMDLIADLLGMPRVRVYEVASFYTMYNLSPVGAHLVEVCTTTPCWLRGSGQILAACERHLGIQTGQTTEDGAFSLREAECLGACVNAPMMQIGELFYEDLTPEATVSILESLGRGEKPKPGPQSDRHASEPQGKTKTVESRKTA